MNSVKKILVLGGTGAIGSHVVNILAQENNLVSVTSRSIRENKEKIFEDNLQFSITILTV